MGAAAVILLGLNQLNGNLLAIGSNIGRLHEYVLGFTDFSEFVAGQVSGEDEKDRDAHHASIGGNEIKLDAVSYRYPGASRWAVRNISLSLRKGSVTAVVGENGSGKTTLAKLCSGLYRATEGRVLWDGVPYESMDVARLHRSIAFAFQDFLRFQFSARENIAIGDVARLADEKGVVMAAERAGLRETVERLPMGYETMLSKEYIGGSDLSGGQWQRFAIARCFFRDAQLLILDEPSAALDARSEEALFETLRDLAHDRAVMFITHRLSTVTMADQVVVLDDGEMVELGSHAELLGRNGLYAELFRLQASHYQVEGPSA